jgi:hypothetical protein
MERPKKYEKEDNINLSEADRAKQSMLNYIQASRALSIAVPVIISNNKNSTNHHDQELELKKRHTSKKKHRHSSRRHHHTLNQSSTSDEEENHFTAQDIDLLLTKEAYEAAEDLSFIANHMRSACHYEEVIFCFLRKSYRFLFFP